MIAVHRCQASADVATLNFRFHVELHQRMAQVDNVVQEVRDSIFTHEFVHSLY